MSHDPQNHARPVPPPPGSVPVSVIVPTLNESKNLPRCLDHLAWADEVVVIDSGSTDDTVAIARRYGARVIDFKWNGQWPKKRNWALRHAELTHPWILMVDADEWIVPELAAEIAEAIKTDHYVGYWVNRRFIFMGRWLKHCGYYPSWNLRLVKRGYGEFERLTGVEDTGSGDNEVHEHVVPRGPVAQLKHDMLHFAFPSIHVFVEKHNRYSNWEAAVQLRHAGGATGERARSVVVGNAELTSRRKLKTISRYLPFRPTLRFLYSYVWKLGCLDGWPGFVFCRLLAMYEFLSVAKFYEMRQAAEDDRRARRLSAVPEKNFGPSADRDGAAVGARQSDRGVR
jgi:glycosyltransferase involved in cell wall biosynthesis